MSDSYKEIYRIQRKALDLAKQGKLSEAKSLYHNILKSGISSNHHSVPEIYGQLAMVLTKQKRMEEALEYHKKALDKTLKQDSNDNSTSRVMVYRYFLANHLLKLERFIEANEVISPSVGRNDKNDRLLLLIKSMALWKQGHKDEARNIAQKALSLCSNDEQLKRVSEYLSEIINIDH